MRSNGGRKLGLPVVDYRSESSSLIAFAWTASDCLLSRQEFSRGKALYQLVLCFTHRLPSRINH
jgi:hypothetical protein